MSARTRRVRRPLLRSARFWVPVSLAAVLVGLAWLAVTVTPSVLTARDELEKAIPYAAAAQKAATSGDAAAAAAAGAEMRTHTARARAATQSRAWTMVERMPWVGENLAAVRVAAEEADRLTGEVVIPMADVGVDAIRPVDGRIDLAAVRTLSTTVSRALTVADLSGARLSLVDRAALLPQVAAGIDRLAGEIATLRPSIVSVDNGLKVLPAVLGGDGPRNYLLLFQNSGEVMPGGGTIDSLAEVHADNGALTITRQSSGSAEAFPAFPGPVVGMPPGSQETYPDGLGSRVQSLTRTPRFDLSSKIAHEMWKQRTGVAVDGVIAVDTVALSYIMAATGPIDLPDGSKLDIGNAVSMLLGDLYATFPPEEVDAISQSVVAMAFARIASGDVDMASLTAAVSRAGDEQRIRLWGTDAGEQSLLKGSPFEGEPPASTTTTDAFGVYFIDSTPGRMQRFMTQGVDLAQAVCAADGKRHVRVRVSLANTVTPDQALTLPDSVTGGGASTAIGSMRVDTLVYAPPGSTMVGVSRNGQPAPSIITTDGDYPVNRVGTTIAPGETAQFDFDVLATDDDLRTLSAEVTPVVSPTSISTSKLDCG
ncbi:DUF4012 domain-containing protein [Orlajensenia leifsoniae]|uniref:DUF4012 domain-containing protein n=1 Tax=Orlajensenia leifsoniae TaxID=2561933 RepID=A0A4Y9QU66_9MICO|nr:DUF4012 domain-containing protein [Leifsonia flava]TFV95112.1 DUF4012 domain-containing protein [Leifsonia flava]